MTFLPVYSTAFYCTLPEKGIQKEKKRRERFYRRQAYMANNQPYMTPVAQYTLVNSNGKNSRPLKTRSCTRPV